MSSRRYGGRWIAIALILISVALSPAVAQADRLAELVEQLTPYSLKDDRVFDTMGELAEVERQGETATERNAARFLRTMAAVDLWLVARFRDEQALHARIAAAVGQPRAQLDAGLVRTLELFERSAYADTTEDAKRAVQRLRGTLTPAQVAIAPQGVREALVVLLQAGAAADAPLPLSALAAVAGDPCLAQQTCAPRFAHLGAQGRRAALALEHASLAQRQLETARHADPLLGQLEGLIDAAHVHLLPLELSPDVRLADGVSCPDGGCGMHGQLDLIVRVEEGQVHLSRAPRLRVNAQGQVENVQTDGPVWPEARTVRLPGSYPCYIKHIDDVVEAIEALSTGEGMRVAVGASEDVPSHEWARVVLSARRAGSEEPMLLARSASGDSRVAPLRVVTAFGAPKLDPSDLDVFVLARGHMVRRRGGESTTIERVAAADGRSQWNFEALAERAAPAQAGTAQLRFLPDLPAETVLRSAVAMAPTQRQLTLILP